MPPEDKIHPQDLPYIYPDFNQADYRFPLVMNVTCAFGVCQRVWTELFSTLPKKNLRMLFSAPHWAASSRDSAVNSLLACATAAGKILTVDMMSASTNYAHRNINNFPEVIAPYDLVYETSGEMSETLMACAVAYRTLIVTSCSTSCTPDPSLREDRSLWDIENIDIDYENSYASPTRVELGFSVGVFQDRCFGTTLRRYTLENLPIYFHPAK